MANRAVWQEAAPFTLETCLLCDPTGTGLPSEPVSGFVHLRLVLSLNSNKRFLFFFF